MSIIVLKRSRSGKYYKKGFNSQDKEKYFSGKNSKKLFKSQSKKKKQTLNCIEIDCINMLPCQKFIYCLNNNRLAYKTNKNCYLSV